MPKQNISYYFTPSYDIGQGFQTLNDELTKISENNNCTLWFPPHRNCIAIFGNSIKDRNKCRLQVTNIFGKLIDNNTIRNVYFIEYLKNIAISRYNDRFNQFLLEIDKKFDVERHKHWDLKIKGKAKLRMLLLQNNAY